MRAGRDSVRDSVCSRREPKSTAGDEQWVKSSLLPTTQCRRIIRVVRGSTDLRYAHDSDGRIPREIKPPPRGVTRARVFARTPALHAAGNGRKYFHSVSPISRSTASLSRAFRIEATIHYSPHFCLYLSCCPTKSGMQVV